MERWAFLWAALVAVGCAAPHGAARSGGAATAAPPADAARDAAADRDLDEARRMADSDPWGALERYLAIARERGPSYRRAGEVQAGIAAVIDRAWQARVGDEASGKAPFAAVQRGASVVAALTEPALVARYRARLAEARAAAQKQLLTLAARYKSFRFAALLQTQLAARVEEEPSPVDLAPLEAQARGPGWKVEVRAPPACRPVADALSGSLPHDGARICRVELLECAGALSDQRARQEIPCPKDAPAGAPCVEERVVNAYAVRVTARIDGVALVQASDATSAGDGGARSEKEAIAALAPRLAADLARSVERRIEHEAEVAPPVGNNNKDLTEAARDEHYLRLLLAGPMTRTPDGWGALERQIEAYFRSRHGIADLTELRGILRGAP